MTEPKPRRGRRALGLFGSVLYLIVGWLYLGSGLVMPYPWVFVMWALWIAGLAVLARVLQRSPAWTPIVPLAAVIIWVTVVQLGDWLLGWTA
jgi:hypothetical protein